MSKLKRREIISAIIVITSLVVLFAGIIIGGIIWEKHYPRKPKVKQQENSDSVLTDWLIFRWLSGN